MKHLAFGLLVAGLAFGSNAAHAAPSHRHDEVDYRRGRLGPRRHAGVPDTRSVP